LVGDKPTLEPVEQMTDNGWLIVDHKPLVDINLIATQLNREPKTIMNELIRGAYLEIPQCIAKQTKFYCYSKDASDNKHIKTFRVRRKQQLKIYQHRVLLDFVVLHKNKQSLNSIANRTYIENFGVTISHQTLYNYVDNPIMLEINRS
jgi:IS30 family transposase